MYFVTITGSLAITAAVLSTLSVVSAAPNSGRPHKTRTRTYSQISPYPTAPFTYIGGGEGIPASASWGIPPAPSPAPQLKNKRAVKANDDGQPFTIHIENTVGNRVQMLLKHTEGERGAMDGAHNGPLPPKTQIVYHKGWGGRIHFGPVVDEEFITHGSTIEASFGEGKVSFDVSYAGGYTYPIVCSCQGEVKTGCNYPCNYRVWPHTEEEGGYPELGNKISYNSDEGNMDKEKGSYEIPFFFQPCHGAASLSPNDFKNWQQCYAHEITCCVGIRCPRNPAQRMGERDIEFKLGNGTLPANTA